MRRASVVLQILAALLCVAAAARYIASDQFMPYHATVAGTQWELLSPGLQSIIRGMLRIVGGGFLACGAALAALAIPAWRGERWAYWSSLMVGLAIWVPTLTVTLMLKTAAPAANPPTLPTLLVLVVIAAAFVLGMLSRRKRALAA